MESTIIRCRYCSKKNRVAIRNLDSKLKCGHCGQKLIILDSPLNIGEETFEREVLQEAGLVCVIFSADT